MPAGKNNVKESNSELKKEELCEICLGAIKAED